MKSIPLPALIGCAILSASLLALTGCQNLSPESRAALLQFGLKAGDAVLVKVTK